MKRDLKPLKQILEFILSHFFLNGSSSYLFKASSTIQKRNLIAHYIILSQPFFSSNIYYLWTFLTDEIHNFYFPSWYKHNFPNFQPTPQASQQVSFSHCIFFLHDHSTLITPVTKLKTSTALIFMLCFAPYLQLAGVPLGPQFLSQQPFPFHVSLL